MKFDLSEEQQAFQDATDRCLADQLDQIRLLEIFESEDGHDENLWRSLADMGLVGILVPEAYGGAGLDMLDAAIVAESLGRHAAPGPFLGHMLATLAIAEGGTETQKERWLPGLASGEVIGTVAIGESANRWQPDQWHLKASDPVNGRKMNLLYPEQADVFVVGVAGGGLVLVERDVTTQEITLPPSLDATRRIGHIVFKDSSAEPMNLSGERLRDAGLVLLAADAFGGAQRCVDMAIEYAKVREQFGRVIAGFQALKHQLVNMAVEVEPARGLYWYAAYAFDAAREDSPRMAALAKAHIADRFIEVSRTATEVRGGIGYTWKFPLHVWLKRAVFDRTYLGSSSVHRHRAAELAGWST